MDDDDEHPTPEQIAQRCAEIQAGWSEAERRKRQRVTPVRSVATDGVEDHASFELAERLARQREAMRKAGR